MSALRQRKAGSKDQDAAVPAAKAVAETVEDVDGKKKSKKQLRAPVALDRHGHFKAGLQNKTFLDKHGVVIMPIALLVLTVLVLRYTNRGYPLTYAVCSRSGSIFITPDKTVQCIVVDHDIVKDYGSLEETRTKYGDLDTLGAFVAWPGKLNKKAGIKIYYQKEGRAVFPGFTDAHGHIMEFGHSLSQLDLRGSKSKEEVISKLKLYIARLPKGKKANRQYIIEGHGFDQTLWPGGQWPTARDLEGFEGRRIFFTRIDLHACWVSPFLLKDLKIPDHIEGGVILRDAQGKPTGVFLDTAFEYVMNQLPKPSLETRLEYYTAATRKLVLSGITGVHDAKTTLQDADMYRRLDKIKRLPLRVYGMVACDKLDEYCGDEVERYDGDRFTLRSAKIFLDGALGGWGSAMLEPYSDKPKEKGIVRMPIDKYREVTRKWVEKGFQVNTHAIGDAANQQALDVYEEILSERGENNDELRFRIEHAQIMTQADIARAGRLGIIASMQPTHATSDMGYAEQRLGPERIKGAYAWQSLLKAGARLALGSDFPVERINPIEGYFASITRTNASGWSPHGPDGWFPSEKLTRQQALQGFTSWAAYARFSENSLGRLEKGMKADFVILNKDILTVKDTQELRRPLVRATVVGGRVEWGGL